MLGFHPGMHFSSSVPTNIPVSETILLHFNGSDASTTITDEGGHTFTAQGDAQIDTAQSKFGGASGLFDGTGDYVSTPDSADFTLGSNNFTVSCWVRRGADGVLHWIAGRGDGNNATTSFGVQITSGNKARFSVFVSAVEFAVEGSTNITADGLFHHIEGVRNGTDIHIFVDGVLDGTTGSVVGSLNNPSTVLSVGALGSLATNRFNGHIDEFLFVVGQALHTSTFTPPAVPYS